MGGKYIRAKIPLTAVRELVPPIVATAAQTLSDVLGEQDGRIIMMSGGLGGVCVAEDSCERITSQTSVYVESSWKHWHRL
jgi:hypothetical protein